ncbi:MAG: peptidylprolyl isomerase [Betaproteobacteria bacterium]|nr:peptidylprolyl isomerase [Betaproteobacteria bacterium]
MHTAHGWRRNAGHKTLRPKTMFDWVDKHKRWIQLGLLVLIVPSFAFFGINYYFNEYGDAGVVAKVAGTKISTQDFERALQERQQQLRQMMKDKADPALLNSNEVRNSVINALVEKRALLAHALHSGIAVPDAEVQKIVSGIPYFQDQATGKFSLSRYNEILKSQGMTPVMFEERLRQDLRVAQSRDSVVESAFVSDAVVKRLGAIRGQRRVVSEWKLSPAKEMGQVKVTDEEVKKEYDTHPENFRIPQRVRVNYIVLSPDSVAKDVKVTDQEIKAYYDAHISQYETKEERRASHILITVPKDATPEQKAKAKAKAETILAEVKKAPSTFADVARKESDDPGSAKSGGDLGFFPEGQMVKQFDEAVFSMKPGQIEGPIETQYGFHIIRLDAIKPVEKTPLAQVRSQIEEELRKPKVTKAIAEKAEQFQELVYSQSDSLKPAADALNLPIQTSDWITPNSKGNPLLSKPELLGKIFSDDAIKDKRNTEAVEVEPNTLVAAHVIDYRAASLLPFDDVKSDIREHLKVQKAVKIAAEEGRATLERLRKSGDDTALTWSAPTQVSLENPGDVPPEAARDVFSADTSKLPAYVGADSQSGNYVIYRISQVIDAPPLTKAEADELEKQIANIAAQQELDAYVQAVKAGAGVSIDTAKVDKRSEP